MALYALGDLHLSFQVDKTMEPFGSIWRHHERKIKKQVNEKQVVFWSEKYAKRAKAEREAALTKARDLAKNPGNYIRATSYGAAKYVKK